MERVLLIAPSLDLRGSTLYTLTLARELRLRGYRVTVMSPGGVFAPELQRDKVPLIQADISGFFPRDFLYLRRLRSQAREVHPELIHVTDHSLADLGGHIAAGVETGYVFTIQSRLTSMIRIEAKWFRHAIAASQGVRQAAVSAGGLPRDKVAVIEYGAATEMKPPRRRPSGLTPVVGTVCALERDQGLKPFLRTAAELLRRGVRASFLILGSGPYEQPIRRFIRKLSLEHHVTIAAAMPSYRRLVSPIDVFVSPGAAEGFSVFVLQAMSLGIPVVTSAAGGIFSLIVDNETGLIVPKRSVSLFADKIQAYLDDKDFAERLGTNGFYLVQKQFPLHRMLESTLGVYGAAEPGSLESRAL